MLPANGVFSIGTVWSHHFVKSGDTIAYLEFGYVCAHGVDGARDIVALIYWPGFGNPFCDFPGGTLEVWWWDDDGESRIRWMFPVERFVDEMNSSCNSDHKAF